MIGHYAGPLSMHESKDNEYRFICRRNGDRAAGVHPAVTYKSAALAPGRVGDDRTRGSGMRCSKPLHAARHGLLDTFLHALDSWNWTVAARADGHGKVLDVPHKPAGSSELISMTVHAVPR